MGDKFKVIKEFVKTRDNKLLGELLHIFFDDRGRVSLEGRVRKLP